MEPNFTGYLEREEDDLFFNKEGGEKGQAVNLVNDQIVLTGKFFSIKFGCLVKIGKIFKWRINIIDLLVLIFLIGCLPIGYFGYKILTKRAVEIIEEPTEYIVYRNCPNCGLQIKLKFPFGELIPETYTCICPNCKNEIEVISPPAVAEYIPVGKLYRKK